MLMSDSAIDVLIVGGGPTGLTLAIDLVRRGLNVRLVDKASDVFEVHGPKVYSPAPWRCSATSTSSMMSSVVVAMCPPSASVWVV